MCTFGVRSKDAGAYDLGELDQALFLYLDGQDPSTVNQDQRREPSLSLPPSLSLSFFYCILSPFHFSVSAGKILFGKGCLRVTGKTCSAADCKSASLPTVLSLTRSCALLLQERYFFFQISRK
jgi:hypothetical protein